MKKLSKKRLNNLDKYKTLEFLIITVDHLKDLRMLNSVVKEMRKKHLIKET